MHKIGYGVALAAAMVISTAGGAQTPMPPRTAKAPADYPAPTNFPNAREDLVRKSLAEARAAAGPELFGDMVHRCIISPVYKTRVFGIQYDGKIMPTRVFDNFFSVGQNAVSAFALKTSAGIILFDTLNSEAEARELLVPNMIALGLDPKDIKYIVITHGHGDHYGGAAWLQKTYGAKVVSSAIDWKLMQDEKGKGPFKDLPVPQRDIDMPDGGTLTLGDTSVKFYVTPGHTPGVLSSIFEVRDHGVKHVAGFFGGTGGGTTLSATREHIASLARWSEISAAAGVDVVVANHPLHNGALEKEEILRHSDPGAANPFVLGTALSQRYVAVQSACAKLQLARMGEEK